MGPRVTQGWMGQQSHSRATSQVWGVGSGCGEQRVAALLGSLPDPPGSLLGHLPMPVASFPLGQAVCCRGSGMRMSVPAQEDGVRSLRQSQGSTCDRALFRRSLET